MCYLYEVFSIVERHDCMCYNVFDLIWSPFPPVSLFWAVLFIFFNSNPMLVPGFETCVRNE